MQLFVIRHAVAEDARPGHPGHGKKCGVLWLEGTAAPGGMQVRASIPPKLLRAIAS
jgi:hypothetical protein